MLRLFTRNLSQYSQNMNVLVYSGPGTTPDSVKNCLESLRRYLSPYYAVVAVDPKLLIQEPWAAKTSLLVLPGGADVPMCKQLNGLGNKAIKDFIRRGGKFLSFCAGAYFSSSRVEFEVGDLNMEVSGSRELKFFPGIARGCAFRGFNYGSHVGAKLAKLKINRAALNTPSDYSFNYYNGGPVFVDADQYDSVTVLAEYEDELSVDSGSSKAAAIHCIVGEGAAILCGTHPEFVPDLLIDDPEDPNFDAIKEGLIKHNESRQEFLKAFLQKLDLKVNEHELVRPRLTPLLLSSPVNGQVRNIVENLITNVGLTGDSNDLVKGHNDTFRLHQGEEPNVTHQLDKQQESEDPDKIIKEFYAFTEGLPERKITPYFDIKQYFRHLEDSYGSLTGSEFGSTLLYGEVVTSTSTLLDKNLNILNSLPAGIVATANVQVSGKGRGGNVWVSPPGIVASSLVLDLPIALRHAPVVFLQYLTSLAVLEAIKGLGDGYEELPIRIKWPNDIFAIKPEYFGKEIHPNDIEPSYAKICGILVNTNVVRDNYKCVIGVGLNLSNASPTTSVNSTIKLLNQLRVERGQERLDLITPELFLAKYIHNMNKLFSEFKTYGFRPLLPVYYKHWLHTDQIVHLQDHGFIRAKLAGITDDYGLLVAEEVDRNDRPTGQKYHLQPDGNSFDMFKGLISKKTNV